MTPRRGEAAIGLAVRARLATDEVEHEEQPDDRARDLDGTRRGRGVGFLRGPPLGEGPDHAAREPHEEVIPITFL